MINKQKIRRFVDTRLPWQLSTIAHRVRILNNAFLERCITVRETTIPMRIPRDSSSIVKHVFFHEQIATRAIHSALVNRVSACSLHVADVFHRDFTFSAR